MKGVPKEAMHDALKKAKNVAHIQDLKASDLSDYAWEIEVAAAELEEV